MPLPPVKGSGSSLADRVAKKKAAEEELKRTRAAEQEYVTNLQQQVYFLELELNLLKRATIPKATGLDVLPDGPLDDVFGALRTKFVRMEAESKQVVEKLQNRIADLEIELEARDAVDKQTADAAKEATAKFGSRGISLFGGINAAVAAATSEADEMRREIAVVQANSRDRLVKAEMDNKRRETALETKLGDLNARLSSIESERDVTLAKLEAQNQIIRKLEQVVEEERGKSIKLQHELEKTGNIAVLQTALSAARAESASLSAKSFEMETQMELLQGENQTLKSRNKILQGELAPTLEKISKLESQLKMKQDQMDSLQAEVLKLKTSIKKGEAAAMKANQLTDEVAVLTERLRVQSQQLHDSERKTEMLAFEAGEASIRAEQAAANEAVALKEKGELEGQVVVITEAHDILTKRVAELEVELRTARKDAALNEGRLKRFHQQGAVSSGMVSHNNVEESETDLAQTLPAGSRIELLNPG